MAKEKLTEERKQQLEQLYHDLRRHNFYSVLGVTPEADRADIRRGYFAISKLCHPDNYSAGDLGEHRRYMEKIFQACSKAYDVLSNAKKRKRYDEYLSRKADTAEYATNVLGQAPPAPSEPPPDSRAEARRTRGVREGRRVPSPGPSDVEELPPVQAPSGQREPLVQPPRPQPSVSPPASPERVKAHAEKRRSWRKSTARRGLLGALGNVENLHRERKGKSWIQQARQAQEDGDMMGTLNALRMAVDTDPENQEAKQMLQQTMSSASQELGARYLEQARSELEFGELQLAEVSIARALDHSPDSPDVQAAAANILLQVDGDLHRAYEAIQKAARAKPKNVGHLVLMGKILVKAGLPARAKSVLTKALEMDPKLTEAKRILAGL